MGSAPQGEGRPALAGVRVLDLTQYESGTSCTQALAWMGAEIIKVEPPGNGEPGRRTGTGDAGLDAYYFLMLNNNKSSVTLNLKHEKGREVLRRLIGEVDIFIENFAPGAIQRLGFDYAAVSKINPRIIYAQIKGFSAEGPYGSFLALDSIIQAAGGAVSLSGEPDRPPIKPGITVGDTGAGLHCTIGILAALYQRQFTGRGQRVEVAMQDNVINFTRNAYATQMETGKAAKRSGGANAGGKALRGLYPCKGGGPNDYVFMTSVAGGDRQFQGLMEAIGREDAINDPRFATNEARKLHQADINDMVSGWTALHDKRTVMETLGVAGIPISAVFDTMDLPTDAHLRERNMFVTVNHPVRGNYVTPGWPVKMSDTRVDVEPAPLLGADTDRVLREVLHMTPAEIAALRQESAV